MKHLETIYWDFIKFSKYNVSWNGTFYGVGTLNTQYIIYFYYYFPIVFIG